MSAPKLVSALIALLACVFAPALRAAEPAANGASGPVYVIAHLDVLPMTAGGVDFLQTGYGLLFRYRDQSQQDPGLTSFRILDLVPPTTNHSEIVQTWNSFGDYQRHLAQPHTTAFRFEVQNNPRFGGICCVGSPIDDRLYSLVGSAGTPWTGQVAATVGAGGAVFVISFVEFLPQQGVPGTHSELTEYADATAKSHGSGLLSFSVLRELNRPSRYVLLEIWQSHPHYDAWQMTDATRRFVTAIRPLLAAPIDHRFTILCGRTFVDSVGCVAP